MTKNLLKSLDMSKVASKEQVEKFKIGKKLIAKVYGQTSTLETNGGIYSKENLLKYVTKFQCDPLLDKLRDQRSFTIENLNYLIVRDKNNLLVFSVEHEKNTPQIIKNNYTLYEIYSKD